MPKCSKCNAFVANPREPFVICQKCNRQFHPGCAKSYIESNSPRACCVDNLSALTQVINFKPKPKRGKATLHSSALNQLRLAEACSLELHDDNSLESPTPQSPHSPDIQTPLSMANNFQSEPSAMELDSHSQNSSVSFQPLAPSQMPLPPQWGALNSDERLSLLMQTTLATNSNSTHALQVLNEITPVIKAHTTQIASLEEKVTALESENNDLKRIISAINQPAELKISGIPLDVAHPPVEIAKAVLKHLNIENHSNSILNARNIKYKNSDSTSAAMYKSQAIIVQVASTQLRDFIIQTAKRHGDIFADSIFPETASDHTKQHKIYVNSFHSNFTASLLRKTKEIAKAKGYKFTWPRNGIILTQKNELTPPIEIVTENDLNKII